MFPQGLATNGHGNRNLIKKMGNTLLISILHGLFYVVYSMRARLWYIRMYCDTFFRAMISVDFGGMLWALKILCLVMEFYGYSRQEPVERRTGVWSWGIQAKCIAGMTRVTKFVTKIWDQSMVLLGFWNFFKELWRARCVERIKHAFVLYLDAHILRWPTTQI